MKKSALTILLSTFVLVMILSLSGCNKSTNPTDNNSSTDPTLTNMVVADIQDDVSNVTEPSVENNNDMSLEPTYDVTRPFQCPAMNEGMMKPGFINFMGIMRRLALTDAQIVSIRGYMVDYRDCIHTAQSALRASEKIILDAANVQRRAVMQDLKDAKITKAEARQQLAKIAKDTRLALMNNPDLADFKTATCDCLHSLFDAIRKDLTTDQQTIWDAWVSKLKNKCINP
jgi:hypothetical protein